MSLFGTAGIRGPVDDAVTPALALRVGRAAAAAADEFVVGRDARVTGEGLADALAAGLESGGAAVRRVGVVPTPALAFASQGRHGAMVTASHNPPADNGIKLFADGVEYDREAEGRIATRAQDAPAPASWRAWGSGEAESLLEEYREAVATYAADHGGDATGLAVAVDCGTGTAGLATPPVLTGLGVRVHALNATPDGHVPARPSKPTPETIGDLRAYVAASDVAFGVAHDGDADRIVIVDENGAVVHEDTILAVLAHHYVSRSPAADPVVVTTPNASGRIDERVAAAGGRVERVRLGALHEGVARERAAGGPETAVAFAAEPWKHLHPAFGGWIDGVVSAAVLARLVAAEGLASLTAPVAERPSRKVSVDCPDARKAPAMGRLSSTLPETFPEAAVDEAHGLRLEFPDGGWVLVRPSGTEPKLRIYAESDDVDGLVATVRERVEAAADH
jgi:phosphomannomutase